VPQKGRLRDVQQGLGGRPRQALARFPRCLKTSVGLREAGREFKSFGKPLERSSHHFRLCGVRESQPTMESPLICNLTAMDTEQRARHRVVAQSSSRWSACAVHSHLGVGGGMRARATVAQVDGSCRGEAIFTGRAWPRVISVVRGRKARDMVGAQRVSEFPAWGGTSGPDFSRVVRGETRRGELSHERTPIDISLFPLTVCGHTSPVRSGTSWLDWQRATPLGAASVNNATVCRRAETA
jgi:hypothetical protein